MVGGVPYMGTPPTPAMPRGGGGAGSGLQAFATAYDITTRVKDDVEARRAKRDLDKLIVDLGDKKPTQGQYMKLARYMGADGARAVLQFHEYNRNLELADRKIDLENLGMAMDLYGNVSDVLRTVPLEQRPEKMAEMLNPLVQDNPTMQEMVRPLAGQFADGDFSDEKLDSIAAIASGFGRYQTIHDNRLKAAAKKEAERLDRESEERIEGVKAEAGVEEERVKAAAKIEQARLENPPREQIIALSREMVQTFGGRPADWAIFLRSDDKMIGEGDEGFVNKATNRPLDLGSYSRQSMIPGDPLGGAPPAGSPATIKRRPTGAR